MADIGGPEDYPLTPVHSAETTSPPPFLPPRKSTSTTSSNPPFSFTSAPSTLQVAAASDEESESSRGRKRSPKYLAPLVEQDPIRMPGPDDIEQADSPVDVQCPVSGQGPAEVSGTQQSSTLSAPQAMASGSAPPDACNAPQQLSYGPFNPGPSCRYGLQTCRCNEAGVQCTGQGTFALLE